MVVTDERRFVEATVETSKISKLYRGNAAVSDLSFRVPEGEVFGLLGPNGAGKTTSLRILAGLVRASSGTSWILGREVPKDFRRIHLRVGFLLEAPGFYPTASAAENLGFLAYGSGNRTSRSRILGLLDLVGLADRAHDPVRGYSQGMRQRLGIAAALLHDPEVVFLDEPLTGLDPGGVRDVRALIGGLRLRGRTVILSTHLLAEAALVCDSVGLLDRGSLLGQWSVQELLEPRRAVCVRLPDVQAVTSDPLAKSWNFTVDGDAVTIVGQSLEDVARLLSRNKVTPLELRTVDPSLEDVFFELLESRTNPPDSGVRE